MNQSHRIRLVTGLVVCLIGVLNLMGYEEPDNILFWTQSNIHLGQGAALGLTSSGVGLMFLSRIKYISGLIGIILVLFGLLILEIFILKENTTTNIISFYKLDLVVYFKGTPNIALCFILIGLSYIITEFYDHIKKYVLLANGLLVITGLFAFVAILVYVESLSNNNAWLVMPIDASICFILITISSALTLWKCIASNYVKFGLFTAILSGICSFLLFSVFSIAFKNNDNQQNIHIANLQANLLSDKIRSDIQEQLQSVFTRMDFYSNDKNAANDSIEKGLNAYLNEAPYIYAIYINNPNFDTPILSKAISLNSLKAEYMVKTCRSLKPHHQSFNYAILPADDFICITNATQTKIAVINFHALMQTIWEEQYLTNQFDLEIIQDDNIIFQSKVNQYSGKKKTIIEERVISIMGRDFRIVYYFDTNSFSKDKLELPILLFIFGLLFSILLVLLIRSRQISNYRLIESNKNIEALKKAEENLQYMVKFDQLTNVLNRNNFIFALKNEIDKVEQNNKKLAILFIDIDNFKEINDAFGHQVGDQVLISTAANLSKAVRSSDLIARFGGDEFVILSSELDDIRGIGMLAERCIKHVTEPLEIDNYSIVTSISIGIAFYPDCGESPEVLLKNADLAMYTAKQKGRNNFQVYNIDLNNKLLRQRDIEIFLNSAIKNNEFTLVYQPQLNIIDGTIQGVETLIRWQNTELNNPTPDEFIPIAELTRMINPIGEWIIKKSMQDYVNFTQNNPNLAEIDLSINVSPNQFLNKTFISYLESLIKEVNIPPKNIILEITETALMQNIESMRERLIHLSTKGIRIALDDFGTGYSSMYYLKSLPINIIKIDKKFISDIHQTENSDILINGIISLAKGLGIEIIAEGVETPEQLAFLKEAGCAEIQGYLFSKPLTLDKLVTFADNYDWEY